MKHFTSLAHITDWTLGQLGQTIVMATPLGLGKPNPLVNSIYDRIKADPQRELRIFTALSLARPRSENELQRRLLEPFSKRQFGDDYPDLHYLLDLAGGGLPPNIRVHEFYLQAGKALDLLEVQRDYISVNYTHVVYTIAEQGVNLIVQMIAKNPRKPGFYSLSCNPDLTLDVADYYKKTGRKILMVGMVHPGLPYCGLDAEVEASFFDAVIDSPEVKHELFALPRVPIADADFMIGLQASLLIEDGGTLQIGIGSLSDALIYCTRLRQQNNPAYREMARQLLSRRPFARSHEKLHVEPFIEGLYGTSEMVMDGFMHLRRAGILKREVFDLDESVRCWLHGAFFLGSKEFYAWLRELDSRGESGLCMTRVSKVNDLYDADELAIRRQRVKARFFNTCMSVTLLGGAASDTTEDGQVVSGVGGQYNFVAMSHELPDSFSALMLRSHRHGGRRDVSNIIWGQGQLTIPRHLRDVVISEYGIAFLKNRTDEQVIQAQLCIADSRFQPALQEKAVAESKLSPRWEIPAWAQENDQSFPSEFLAEWKKQGLFPVFPFGSDFTPVEERLVMALTTLKKSLSSSSKMAGIFWRGVLRPAAGEREALERMELWSPRSMSERVYRVLLLGTLR